MDVSSPESQHASLPDDAQAKLDAHLDAVDAVLRQHAKGRSQRSAIVDELEGQLREMLEAKRAEREGVAVDLEDWAHVEAEVDPPEAYARQSIDLPALSGSAFAGFEEDYGSPPKTSGWAIAGLVFVSLSLLLGLLPLFLVLGLFVTYASDQATVGVGGVSQSEPVGGVGILMLPVLFIVPLPLVLMVGSLACGVTAMGKIKAAPHAVGGWGLAVFDVVFFPFWVLWLVATSAAWVLLVLAIRGVRFMTSRPNVPEDAWAVVPWSESLVWLPVAMVVALVVSAWLTRVVVRRLGAWRLA
ncbi:MAG: hypothetical protein AAF328_01860 [Planctomycetota bacterium]